MQDLDDLTLLREYAARQSEAAFAEIVSRRVGFVYSAALRQVRDPHLAEEITQAVFVILAQKAGRISNKTILAGWLFKTTRYAAIAQTRELAKRSVRLAAIEKVFQMQTELQSATPDEIWNRMSPLLDEALAALSETDRQAVLLRFFENKSLAEVGSQLGTGEDTARKRVSRALEKLRRFFSKRGVSSSTAIIAGVMSANSVQAAPVALAKSVTAVAVAKGAAASGSTLTLIKGALKIMAWTKAKMAIVAGMVVLLVAGTTTITVKEIQEQKTYPWEVPKADYEIFYKTEPQVRIVPTKFDQDGGVVADSERGAMGIAQPVKKIVQYAYQKYDLRTVVRTGMPSGKFDFIAKLVNPPAINTNWMAALQSEISRKFGITGRYEMIETNVMVLKPCATGIRGFKVSHEMPNGQATKPIVEKAQSGLKLGISFHEQPLSTLMWRLESRLQIPIVDETGLTQAYDYSLIWNEPYLAAEEMSEKLYLPDSNQLETVLQVQLGLELVPTNMPIEMLVVEKVK